MEKSMSMATSLAGVLLVLAVGCSEDNGSKPGPEAGVDQGPVVPDAGEPDSKTSKAEAGTPDASYTGTYGKACDPATAATCGQDAPACIAFHLDLTKGFCTALCTQPQSTCLGTPPGTFALCQEDVGTSADGGSTVNACIFICKYTGKSWPCPPDLQCQEVQPGTSVCVPK